MLATTSKFALVAGLVVAAAVPAAARAQESRIPGSDGLLTPYGEYVLLGGGATQFRDEAAKDRYDVGGTWDARLGVGSRYFIGGELAYVGSLRSGKGAEPDLAANGAEAVFRLQYPWATGEWLVQPFAFGGIGWSHVSLQDAAPGVKDGDDIGVVPFGAGVTFGYGRALLDARFTYRASFSEDLPLAAGAAPADLQQWAVTASLGYEF